MSVIYSTPGATPGKILPTQAGELKFNANIFESEYGRVVTVFNSTLKKRIPQSFGSDTICLNSMHLRQY